MGTYIDQADLATHLSEAELIELTDDAGAGDVDEAVVASAIADAEAEVDSYLQARYTLPLAAVPQIVSRLAKDVCLWLLHVRRKMPDLAESAVGLQYKAAVRLLERIAKGEAALGIDPPAAVESGGAQSSGEGRVFTLEKLKNY